MNEKTIRSFLTPYPLIRENLRESFLMMFSFIVAISSR